MSRKKPPDDIGGSGGQTTPISTSPVATTGNQAPIHSQDVAGSQFPASTIPPQPIRTLHMPYERAYRLATMPRSKWDEKTWAAFWAAIAALPGAAEAIHSGSKHSPFVLGAFETFQVIILVGFAVWFLVARLNQKEKTSSEYLNELYNLPTAPSKHWWTPWR